MSDTRWVNGASVLDFGDVLLIVHPDGRRTEVKGKAYYWNRRDPDKWVGVIYRDITEDDTPWREGRARATSPIMEMPYALEWQSRLDPETAFRLRDDNDIDDDGDAFGLEFRELYLELRADGYDYDDASDHARELLGL